MYELIKITDRSYYVDCPSKIGIVMTDRDEAVLIDSGSDKDAGKKALKHIDTMGARLAAIYNTHSHADHIGGNKLVSERTGCKIYANRIERDFTEHPILEPSLLYGGAPYSELMNKFLLAAPSPAEYLTEEALPDGWEILPLPGHSLDMVGFRTADGVAYIADALSSRETLDKYGIGYIYDVGAYLQTLERLKTAEASVFVPSHAEPAENIAPLAQYNIDKVNEICDRISALTEGGISFDALLARLFSEYSLTMDHVQHALVGSTVRSYLSYLKKEGRVDIEFRDNTMVFVKN